MSSSEDTYLLDPPLGETRILVHSCCAPCSGSTLLRLKNSGITPTVIFYNPNIHPREEYEIRKEEQIDFCKKEDMPFVDCDYDPDNWYKRVQGFEYEPERGERCTKCFDMRLERAALYAHENNFKVMTSILGISRWKDMNQVNACAAKAVAKYPNLIYWDYNWRKQGGSQEMVELAKQRGFYRQDYCGCVYSLRDIRIYRMQKLKEQKAASSKPTE